MAADATAEGAPSEGAPAEGVTGATPPAVHDDGVDPSRMCSDGHRALISFGCALVVPLVAGIVVSLVDPDSRGTRAAIVLLVLLGWNIFAVLYALLSVRTFSGDDAARFRRQMRARTERRTRLWRRLNPHGDGPTYAIQATIVAFAVVLVLPHVNAVEINLWLLVPVSLTILLSCWALSIVSYALHYAEKDLESPGLEFPGERTHAFADYLYFSIAVATTFGATDVTISTPRMRRVVNLHTVVTFVYNSVIVALLASLILR